MLFRSTRRRSLSLGHKPNGKSAKGNGVTSPTSPTASASSPISPTDWSDFSAVGFGDSSLGSNFASTLFDNDIEVTSPPSRKPSRRQRTSPHRGRRSSLDNPNPTTPVMSRSPKQWKTKTSVVRLTKIDEAFIDFWSDGMTDPVASNWPNFVVAQLKSLPGIESVGWLVIEQTFTRPPPPPEPVETRPVNVRRPSSPRPSMRSEVSARKSSTFAAARKRFSFFSATSKESVVATHDGKTGGRKKAAKAPKVGEMGEILPEVKESTPPKEVPPPPVPAKEDLPVPAAPTALGLIGVADGTGSEPAVAAASDERGVEGEVAASAKPADSTPVQAPSTAVPDTDPGSPGVDAASPISLAQTPTADDFPPVPVDTARPVSLPAAPIVNAPIQTEDTAGSIAAPAPAVVSIPVDNAETSAEAVLPPAPESVVLAGQTPGPQVALGTSEPLALAETSEETEVRIVEPAVHEAVEEDHPIPANGHVSEEQTEEIPTQPVAKEDAADHHEPEATEPTVNDPAPSTAEELTAPQEPITVQEPDLVAEAAGEVVEHTTVDRTSSSNTLDDITTARPAIDVIVSSPTAEAVRAVSETAEVILTTEESNQPDSHVEAASGALEEQPVGKGRTLEEQDVTAVQQLALDDTPKPEARLAEPDSMTTAVAEASSALIEAESHVSDEANQEPITEAEAVASENKSVSVDEHSQIADPEHINAEIATEPVQMASASDETTTTHALSDAIVNHEINLESIPADISPTTIEVATIQNGSHSAEDTKGAETGEQPAPESVHQSEHPCKVDIRL